MMKKLETQGEGVNRMNICITISFIICTLHQIIIILLRKSSQEGSDATPYGHGVCVVLCIKCYLSMKQALTSHDMCVHKCHAALVIYAASEPAIFYLPPASMDRADHECLQNFSSCLYIASVINRATDLKVSIYKTDRSIMKSISVEDHLQRSRDAV
jgi:hypothetical protein